MKVKYNSRVIWNSKEVQKIKWWAVEFMGIFYKGIYADDELIHCVEPYIDKSFNLTMEN